MRKVKIIGDSTCDLSQELLEKYDFTIIPLYILLDEKSYLDQLEITPQELYEWSDRTGKTPKTAAAGMDVIQKALEKYDKNETDLIFFGISEAMSTTCNVVRMVAQDLGYDNLYVVDSKNLSTGIGLQMIKAAEMADKGMSAADIVSAIEAQRGRVRASFVIDTMTYLYRGGRCNAMTALMASALKIKPRISVIDGKMDVTKKYRGNIHVVTQKYAKDLEEDLKDAEDARVFITHSGCSDEIVADVREYLEGLHHFKEILVTQAGSVISSHCGPNTLGVLFYAHG